MIRDLNIEKEPVYVLDLLSRNNLWLNKDYNGLNIIILERILHLKVD